jgi:hypothetical protein
VTESWFDVVPSAEAVAVFATDPSFRSDCVTV